MKLIKPSQVSGEILTFFEEADEKIIIVSPYCKIQKWYKLKTKLKSLKERKIDLEFYVRDGETETIEEIKQIGITPICVRNLHCKMYFNEKEAIVSSMNLLLSSEINSLEIAYKTTNKDEYNELVEFYNRYLKPLDRDEQKLFDINHLFDTISKTFEGTQMPTNKNKFSFKIKRNNYSCFISNNVEKKGNELKINGILTSKEFEYSKGIIDDIIRKTELKIECIEGSDGKYDRIWGTSIDCLETQNINNILSQELDLITKNIVNFLFEIENIKSCCY